MSPTQSIAARCTAQARLSSPLGSLLLARTEAGLAGVWFEAQKWHPEALQAPERPDDQPFTEPWQARAFAMAVVAAERLDVPWDEFRDRLKAAIAARPGQPYYESWMDALEALVSRREAGTVPGRGQSPSPRPCP